MMGMQILILKHNVECSPGAGEPVAPEGRSRRSRPASTRRGRRGSTLGSAICRSLESLCL